MTFQDPSAVDPPSLRSPRPPRAGRTWLVSAIALVIAGLGALLVVAALVLFGLYRRGDAFLTDVADAFGAQPTSAPVLDTRAVVVEKLQDAAELTTLVYTLETVVSESQDRSLAGFKIGSTELLYIANGQVRAGVDLAKLGRSDVDIEQRSGVPIDAALDGVTVQLPAPEILGASLDVERSRVYDMRRSLFGPVDPDLQSRAERFALTRIVEGACDADVLTQANNRAATAVRALLEAAGAREVTVKTRPPGPCRWPASPANPL